MKIVVAIKQVPARDSYLKPDAAGIWIDESDLSWEINEPDAYALEAGLQFREAQGSGEVIVLCAGPDRATSTIREALAKGADRAIHIETESLSDPLSLARAMAKAIGDEKPDLILTGLQSDDFGYGQTGVVLAEVLGYAHSTLVMSMEPAGTGIKVKQELEDGWFRNIEMPLPAVLAVQSGAAKLRYATLMGIKKAKSKEIKVVSPESGSEPQVKIEKVYLPQKTKQSQILTGPDAAAQLVEKLRFEARVL